MAAHVQGRAQGRVQRGGGTPSGGMFSLATRRDKLHLMKCDETGAQDGSQHETEGRGEGGSNGTFAVFSCLRNLTFRRVFFRYSRYSCFLHVCKSGLKMDVTDRRRDGKVV